MFKGLWDQFQHKQSRWRVIPQTSYSKYTSLGVTQFNVELRMDFFDKHHIVLPAKKHMMTLSYKDTSVCLDAFSESDFPKFHSDFIELCTLRSLSQTVPNMPSDELDEAFVAYIKPDFDLEASQSS